MDQDSPAAPSRRTVVLAGAGTALGVVALAACSTSPSGSTGASGDAGPASSGASGGGAGGVLVKVADVPVGGAVSATDARGRPVIVSQPTAGHVVAFSAICTHMGCTVAPAQRNLQCPCHGSTYDLATGKNTGGPAPRPLASIAVTVTGGSVVES